MTKNGQEIFAPHYLGSDLVAALAGLDVDDFPHFVCGM